MGFELSPPIEHEVVDGAPHNVEKWLEGAGSNHAELICRLERS